MMLGPPFLGGAGIEKVVSFPAFPSGPFSDDADQEAQCQRDGHGQTGIQGAVWGFEAGNRHRNKGGQKAADHPRPGAGLIDALPIQRHSVRRQEGAGDDSPGIGHHFQDRSGIVSHHIRAHDENQAENTGQLGQGFVLHIGLQLRLHQIHGYGGARRSG